MAQINEQLINDVVRKVLDGFGGAAPASAPGGANLSAADYPLGSKRKELLKSPRGIPFTELTLDNIESGKVGFEDFSITPDVLKMQGDIALSAGRKQMGQNFARAAEMTKIPDARLLEMYGSLRPHRSTEQELLSMADELQNKFGASECAKFVREAAGVYKRRKLLKGDLPVA